MTLRDLFWNLHERYHPIVFGGIAGIVSYYFEWVIPSEHKGDILSASLTFGAIVVGFLATSKTILIGYKDNPAYQKLQSLGYIDRITDYLASAITVNLLYCALIMLCFFYCPPYFMSLWMSFGVYGMLTFYRVVMLQIKLLKV